MTPTTCAALQTAHDCQMARTPSEGGGAGVGIGAVLAVAAVVLFLRRWEALGMTDFNPSGTGHQCPVKGCTNIRAPSQRLCSMHASRVTRHGTASAPDGRKANGGGRVLTAEQCIEIRRLAHNFVSQIEIARRMDVSAKTVAKVLKGTYRPKDAT